MNRLTDRKTAEDLRRNVEGLQKAGIEPDISDLRYIRLAAYEDAEENGVENMTDSIKKPYPSMLTPSGYKYRCPDCGGETLTTNEHFCCEHCGYEVDIHIPVYE